MTPSKFLWTTLYAAGYTANTFVMYNHTRPDASDKRMYTKRLANCIAAIVGSALWPVFIPFYVTMYLDDQREKS